MVGSIRQTYMPGETGAKGEEKGYFAFGGSSVAVLFEKGRSSSIRPAGKTAQRY
ncbi:MAG: hypothetical protein CM1200mP29_07490 [Verrucomicrobiota bacterium]|nr:MAG: hypothetical protein CM1200mP29_07490 [Verrucomicrobiota bacterium]